MRKGASLCRTLPGDLYDTPLMRAVPCCHSGHEVARKLIPHLLMLRQFEGIYKLKYIVTMGYILRVSWECIRYGG